MTTRAVAWRVRGADALRTRELSPGAVHLWAVRLAHWEDEPRALCSVLSDEERGRADRFVFARHRRQYVISHAFLRRVLSSYVGVSPDELRFARGPHDKPEIALPRDGADLHFNLSHCDELALVGVARAPLGVDVEVMRELTDWEGLACQFHPSEHRALASLPTHERRAAFYRCWTTKEAVVKAIGAGLSMPLDSFEVTLAAGAPPALVRHDHRFPRHRTWHLRHLQPSPGVTGALAAPFSVTSIRGTFVAGPIAAPAVRL